MRQKIVLEPIVLPANEVPECDFAPKIPSFDVTQLIKAARALNLGEALWVKPEHFGEHSEYIQDYLMRETVGTVLERADVPLKTRAVGKGWVLVRMPDYVPEEKPYPLVGPWSFVLLLVLGIVLAAGMNS